MTRRSWKSHFVLITAIALAWPAETFAQKAIDILPLPRLNFLNRLEGIGRNDLPSVFLGSASVAPNNGYPWMVSLQVKGPQSASAHFCGGIVVEKSWVLTAAHCVVPDEVTAAATLTGRSDIQSRIATTMPAGSTPSTPPQTPSAPSGVGPAGADADKPADASKIQVLVRSNVLSLGGEVKLVERIAVHPDFRVIRRVPQNDLALLKITDSPNLTPMSLAIGRRATEFMQGGALIRIMGWGTASFDPRGAISNNLLYAFVEVVDRTKCNEPAVYDGMVTDSMFCAGLGVADACQGDSGGPAIGYVAGVPYLVGVTSWGAGCNKKYFPGVYVNVAKYSGWIGETIASSR